MKKFTGLALIVCLFMLAGCAGTLDKEASYQNDVNMQRVTRENDEDNAKKLADGTVTATTKAIKDERNHKSRRLARAMARDAGNEGLPIIPTEMEKEPEWTDPEAVPE
jgi:hypothetical protein